MLLAESGIQVSGSDVVRPPFLDSYPEEMFAVSLEQPEQIRLPHAEQRALGPRDRTRGAGGFVQQGDLAKKIARGQLGQFVLVG